VAGTGLRPGAPPVGHDALVSQLATAPINTAPPAERPTSAIEEDA
jgi:hypothetical protein